MLDRLKALFLAIFGRLAERDDYWTVDYEPTDLEEVDRRIGITTTAEENGKKGLPRPDSTELDYGQKAILSYFSQLLATLHIRTTTRLAQYGSSSGVVELERAGESISQACDVFQRVIEQRISRFRDELKEQLSAISGAEAEVKRFKEIHGLDREPKGPDSLFLYLSFPVFLFAIDVAFNAAVFKDASPSGEGLKSGIWTAFLLAFFNVILAALFGYWLRYINSAAIVTRAFGWFCAGALALYIPLNAFVAHFRDRVLEIRRQMDVLSFDQIVAQRQNLLPDAATHLFDSPFGLSSIESFALAVIGLLCAYFAAADGYRMDDPVPGYTSVRHRLTSLEVGLFDLKEEFRNAVAKTYKEAIDGLTTLSKRLQETLHRIHNFFALRERLVAVYNRQSRDYADSCATLITKYRDANLRSRGDIPSPDYFNDPPPKPKIPTVEFEALADARDVSHYDQAVLNLQSKASDASKCIHDRWLALQVEVKAVAEG